MPWEADTGVTVEEAEGVEVGVGVSEDGVTEGRELDTTDDGDDEDNTDENTEEREEMGVDDRDCEGEGGRVVSEGVMEGVMEGICVGGVDIGSAVEGAGDERPPHVQEPSVPKGI